MKLPLLLLGVPFLYSGGNGYVALVEAENDAGPTLRSILPPIRFHGDNGSPVVFVDDPHPVCLPYVLKPLPEGVRIKACVVKRTKDDSVVYTVLPNPCRQPGYEYFAQVACHELGHINGWSGQHEE